MIGLTGLICGAGFGLVVVVVVCVCGGDPQRQQQKRLDSLECHARELGKWGQGGNRGAKAGRDSERERGGGERKEAMQPLGRARGRVSE